MLNIYVRARGMKGRAKGRQMRFLKETGKKKKKVEKRQKWDKRERGQYT